MPFDELTFENAIEYIPDRQAVWLKANQAFYRGDHWQNGAGWSGPKPEQDMPDQLLYSATMKKVAAAFVSRNIVKEVIDRHTGGVVGRPPRWGLTADPYPHFLGYQGGFNN